MFYYRRRAPKYIEDTSLINSELVDRGETQSKKHIPKTQIRVIYLKHIEKVNNWTGNSQGKVTWKSSTSSSKGNRGPNLQ